MYISLCCIPFVLAVPRVQSEPRHIHRDTLYHRDVLRKIPSSQLTQAVIGKMGTLVHESSAKAFLPESQNWVIFVYKQGKFEIWSPGGTIG